MHCVVQLRSQGATKSKPEHNFDVSKGWSTKRYVVPCLHIKNTSNYHGGVLEESEKYINYENVLEAGKVL